MQIKSFFTQNLQMNIHRATIILNRKTTGKTMPEPTLPGRLLDNNHIK